MKCHISGARNSRSYHSETMKDNGVKETKTKMSEWEKCSNGTHGLLFRRRFFRSLFVKVDSFNTRLIKCRRWIEVNRNSVRAAKSNYLPLTFPFASPTVYALFHLTLKLCSPTEVSNFGHRFSKLFFLVSRQLEVKVAEYLCPVTDCHSRGRTRVCTCSFKGS